MSESKTSAKKRMVDVWRDPEVLSEMYRKDPAVLHYDWSAFKYVTLPGEVGRLEFLQAAEQAGILTAKGYAELKRLRKAEGGAA
jgi:hypothetical protein